MDEQVGAPSVEDQAVVQTAPMPEPNRAPAATPPTVTQGPATGQENPGINAPPVKQNLGSEAFQNGDMAKEIAPTWEQDLLNRGIMAGVQSTSAQLSDWFDQKTAELNDQLLGVAKISPDDANKQFPGMPEPFTKPIDPAVARLQYDRYQSQKLRQQWAMHGGDHPWEDFALGAAVGIFDPVNVAAAVGTEGASELVGLGGGFGTAGMSFTKQAALSLGKNTLIGGGLMAASYEFEKSQHTAPDLESTLKWGAAQIVGMTALHAGWIKAFGDSEAIEKAMPKDLQEEAIRGGIAQEESGAKIDTTPQAVEAKARMAGEMEGQRSPYRFQPLEHPSDKPFYAALNSDGKQVQLAPTEQGFHAVDDPMAANHMAGKDGKVGEVNFPKDAKFIKGDEPLPEDVLKIAEDAIKSSGHDFSPEDIENLKDMPASDVLNAISQDSPDGKLPPEVSQALKEAGYSGVRYTATDELGKPVHNGVVSFDPSEPSRVWQADSELAKGVPDAQKEAFLERSMGSDGSKTATPEITKELYDAKHETSLNSTDDYLDDILKENLDQAQARLEEFAKTNPDLKSELDDLKEDKTRDAQEKQAAKDLGDCITGSLT